MLVKDLLIADSFFNAQNIIFLITKTVDIFVVLIIGISAFQVFMPLITSVVKFKEKVENNNNNSKVMSFISSLLLALELESANAILKMGLFISNTEYNDYTSAIDNINFIFFVAVLSVRTAINQTLRRFNIERRL